MALYERSNGCGARAGGVGRQRCTKQVLAYFYHVCWRNVMLNLRCSPIRTLQTSRF